MLVEHRGKQVSTVFAKVFEVGALGAQRAVS